MSKLNFQQNYPRYNYLWRGQFLIYKGFEVLSKVGQKTFGVYLCQNITH